MESRQPLIALLTQHTECPSVPKCLNALCDDAWQYRKSASRTIPVKELRAIYEIRANINRNRGNPIAGFDELLAHFNTLADTERLKIHFLELQVEPYSRYLIWTNTSTHTLIGILFWPIGEKPIDFAKTNTECRA